MRTFTYAVPLSASSHTDIRLTQSHACLSFTAAVSLRFAIPDAIPFDVKDYTDGALIRSGQKLGKPKTFWEVGRLLNGKIQKGIVWQDQRNNKVYATFFADDLRSETTMLIRDGTMKNGFILEAAASSPDTNEIVLIMMKEHANSDKKTPTKMQGVKVDAMSGKQILEKNYDTSSGDNGLNIWSYFRGGASLQWNVASKRLALALTRFRAAGSDGLNHQGEVTRPVPLHIFSVALIACLLCAHAVQPKLRCVWMPIRST